MAKSDAPRLVGSPEGISFLLLEGDDLSEVRQAPPGACLPLGYLLGISSPEEELVNLAGRIGRLLSRAHAPDNYEAEEASRLIAQIRETAVARRTLESIRDAPANAIPDAECS